MIYRVLGILIVGAAISLMGLIFANENMQISQVFGRSASSGPCEQLTPAQQLSALIKNDFNQLQKNKELPAEWDQISAITMQMNSTLAKALWGQHRPRFKQVKNGAYSLEMEVMDLPDESDPGIIIQASLFDIKSQNKIFEIGRTYTMNQLNKVTTTEQESNSQHK